LNLKLGLWKVGGLCFMRTFGRIAASRNYLVTENNYEFS